MQSLLVLEVSLHLDMSSLSDQILKQGVGRCIPNLEGRVGSPVVGRYIFAKIKKRNKIKTL